MLKILCGVLLCVALAASTPLAQTPLEEIKAGAEETGKAMLSGDYGRLADLTYPKVVEFMGGRAKMVAFLEKEMKEMKAGGFDFMAVSFGQPYGVVKAGGKTFALVPMVLKLKVPDGVVTTDSYLLAVSDAAGKNWTYVSGAGLADEQKVKLILPEIIGKVALPAKKEPTFERAQ